MSATEQQNTQIDALAGALVTHQRYFADLSVEDRQWAFQNPKEAIAIFCDGVKNRPAKVAAPVEPPKPRLIFLKSILLDGVQVSVYKLGKRQTIADMLRAALKLAPDAPLDLVEKLLKERKHTFTRKQLDEMLEKQEKHFQEQDGGEDMGFRTDGWANLVPIEEEDGSVSVVDASRGGGRWRRFDCSLAYDYVWDAVRYLVLGNSDTGNL